MAFEKMNAYILQFGNFEKKSKKKKIIIIIIRGCIYYFVEIFYFEEILSIHEWNLDLS